MKKPEPINELLSEGSLGSLLTRSRFLQQLTRTVHPYLDPTLKNHCQVANFRDNVLVLQVNTPARSTRLRYQVPELINALRQVPELSGLRKIDIHIAPVDQVSTPVLNVRPSPSGQTISVINETANQLNDDGLKAALLRLSRNMNKKPASS